MKALTCILLVTSHWHFYKVSMHDISVFAIFVFDISVHDICDTSVHDISVHDLSVQARCPQSRCPWIPMCIYRYPWISKELNVRSHGIPWPSIELHRFRRLVMKSSHVIHVFPVFSSTGSFEGAIQSFSRILCNPVEALDWWRLCCLRIYLCQELLVKLHSVAEHFGKKSRCDRDNP